ncbi:MAG: SUMF1/EgtB/PvdO family nonheme iron enzyme [Candidatus Omnitrophota bacterium]
MNMKIACIILVVLMSCGGWSVWANNLKVENVSLTAPSSDDKTANIQFDLSWDNSWRNITNHDAVWVFAKYKKSGETAWNHVMLKSSGTNPVGYSQGSGTGLDIAVAANADGKSYGAIIRRDSSGAGAVDTDNVELVWDWGATGNNLDTEDSIDEVRVYGIEMVYVPQASFYIGDGNGASESQAAFHQADNTAALITDSLVNDIKVDSNGTDDGTLTGPGIGVSGPGGLDADNNGVVDNGSFPTGYTSFYGMKYEITQDQWVAFFNTLTDEGRVNRDITGAGGKGSDSVVFRNTVSWTSGDASSTRPDRACNYLSWQDFAAYADWAALRPLTELEYEKACRGAGSASLGEYAWGNNSITAGVTFSGSENGTETFTTEGSNACYNNQTFVSGDAGQGPVRAGIFAKAATTKQQAGAGFYGPMEMTGNVWEYCVGVGSSAGRSFQGTHGDGALETASGFEGNATNADWPGYTSGQGVSGAAGAALKGGSWKATANFAVSARNGSTATTRTNENGGRCGRSLSL